MTDTELVASVQQRRTQAGIVISDSPKKLPFEISGPQLTPQQIADDERRNGEEVAAAERRRRVIIFRRLVEAAGNRYRSCTFDSYQFPPSKAVEYQRQVVAKVREYAEQIDRQVGRGAGLILYGPVGTGKDHLAFSVAGVAVRKFGLSVGWHNGQHWFGRNRDRIDEGGSEDAVIREFRQPDVVVLSDPLPPMGNLTQYQASMLYRAVDARASCGKPTIVTLNVAGDEEADPRLGVPTWDRLKDGAWMILCAWPSFRKPAFTMQPSTADAGPDCCHDTIRAGGRGN
jgi:DNA replication protein DnaC